jgi:hypothetical protein
MDDLVDRLESLLAWLQSDADNIHHLPRDQVQQMRDLLDKKPYAADRIAELEAERDRHIGRANDQEDRADRLSAMLKEAEEDRQIIRDLRALLMQLAQYVPAEKMDRVWDYMRRKDIMPSPFRDRLQGPLLARLESREEVSP